MDCKNALEMGIRIARSPAPKDQISLHLPPPIILYKRRFERDHGQMQNLCARAFRVMFAAISSCGMSR